MKKRRKNIFVTLLLSTVLMLGACSESNASANVDIGSYPESVQSGEISVKYYDEVNRFYEESLEYMNTFNELVTSEAENKSLINDNDHVKAFNKLLTDFNESLSSFTLKPKSPAEVDIDFQMQKVIHFQLQLNEYKLEHLKTKDNILEMDMVSTSSILDNIINDLDDVVITYQILD